MSTRKAKKYAFETVQDPTLRYNFDLLSKQIDQLRSDYESVNFVTSEATFTGTQSRVVSAYPAFTDVPQLKKTIATSGKPVFLGLQPGKHADRFQGTVAILSDGTNLCTGYIRFSRDNDVIWETHFGFEEPSGGPFTRDVFIIPSSLWTIDDEARAGNHEYKVSGAVDGLGMTLTFSFVRLVAMELGGNSAFIR